MKHVRLTQVAGKQAVRELRLQAVYETHLPPKQERQEQRLQSVHCYQNQHADHD